MSHTVVFRGAFFRYLLTYMIYLLVLLAVMAAYYRHNMRSWQNNELELYATALTDKVTEYQKQLSYIESLGQRIELDTRYRSLYRQKADWDNADYVGISAIQRDFSYTMLPYLLVSDCGIYYPDSVIITRFRSYIGEEGILEYYKNYFHVKGFSRDEWLQCLTASARSALYAGMNVSSHEYGQHEAVIWTVPLGYGTLYTVLNIEDLARFFIPEGILDTGYFYITDSQDKSLLSYRYGEDTASSEFYEIKKFDTHTQLNYVIGIPRDYLEITARPLISTLIMYITFLLLGGVMLGIFFAWRNNRPLRNLMSSTRAYVQTCRLPDSYYKNEQTYISGVLKQLHTSVENMTEQLEQRKAEEKRHLLDKAIQGGISSDDSLVQFHQLFPDLISGYRIGILIFKEEEMATENMKISRFILIQHALKAFYGYEITITSTYSDTLVFLLPEPVEKELQVSGKTTENHLQAFLEDRFQQKAQIAVSDNFADVLEIPSVYITTLYRFRAGLEIRTKNEGIAGTSGMPPFVSFDFMYHQQFFEALSNGEEMMAIALIRKIEDKVMATTGAFDDKHIGEVVYRTVYMGTLSGICNILLQVKLNYFEILSGVSIPTIQRFKNVESFFEEIRNCCHDICASLGNKAAKRRQLSKQVMEFIDRHLTDCGLSTQMASDHFRISDNTLQKIVRTAVGKTFAEYVEQGRVEQAVRLLKTTSIPAESVALQYGFSSYNSMYKVFKRRYNLSPKAAAETME